MLYTPCRVWIEGSSFNDLTPVHTLDPVLHGEPRERQRLNPTGMTLLGHNGMRCLSFFRKAVCAERAAIPIWPGKGKDQYRGSPRIRSTKRWVKASQRSLFHADPPLHRPTQSALPGNLWHPEIPQVPMPDQPRKLLDFESNKSSKVVGCQALQCQ